MLLVVQPTSKLSSPIVRCFFHKASSTCTYIVEDPATKAAAIIDSVLDYQLHSARLSTESADSLLSCINDFGLKVQWILDTHVHADHISASAYLKRKLPSAKTAISEHIAGVQKTWANIFNWPNFKCDGSQWDYLLNEREAINIGEMKLQALHTPGHTPACCTFVVGDTIFSGDVIFQPDFGTARCDFPGGSAHTLFDSLVQKVYALPDDYRLFVGHDYPPTSRSVVFETNILTQKTSNKYITSETSKDDFVTARQKRDAELDTPHLLYPSLQFNINAGNPPPSEENGGTFLKIPLKLMNGLEF